MCLDKPGYLLQPSETHQGSLGKIKRQDGTLVLSVALHAVTSEARIFPSK